MKTAYEIAYNGLVYTIKGKPLSYGFIKYLAKIMPTIKPDNEEKLIEEILKITEAEISLNGVLIKSDEMPLSVLNAWIQELGTNANAEISIKVKQEKN